MYQLSTSVSTIVIVSNSNLTQTPLTNICSSRYMPAWKAGASHQEQCRMTCLTALMTTQHFSNLGWKQLVLDTLRAQAPSNSRCTRGLKKCCNSHGLTAQHWILLLYLGRQLLYLTQAILEMSGQGVLRVDNSYSFIAFIILSAKRPKGKHQKSILLLHVFLT